MRFMTLFFVLLLLVPSVTALGVLDIAPQGFTAQPADASYDPAQAALEHIVVVIDELEAQNFSVAYLQDAYAEAQSAFALGNYTTVVTVGQLVTYVRDLSFTLRDQLTLLKKDIMSARDNGVAVDTVLQVHSQAVDALYRGRYDDAVSIMEEAHVSLKNAQTEFNRVHALQRLKQNILLRYKWHILGAVLILAGVSYPVYLSVHKKLLRRRLLRMKSDFEQTQALVKRLQHRCFVEKKMTSQAYKIKSMQYEHHLNELKHLIPVLEARISGKRIVAKHGVIEVK